MTGTFKPWLFMKIILLFLLSATFESCLAQHHLTLPQQQLQNVHPKKIFFEPANGTKNFVIEYLRSEADKASKKNFYRRVATNKTATAPCCQISKAFFIIDRAWLNYNFTFQKTNQKIEKITNTAGELLDNFLSQYSVQNKPNF